MRLSPVISYEQSHPVLSFSITLRSQRENHQRPNQAVLHATITRGTTSQQGSTSRPTGSGTVFHQNSNVQEE
jgi:hypothetical protein